jgi:hypothetical protein
MTDVRLASHRVCARTGMVARGASIAWLSQYPNEDEVLFPPVCALEVARTRVEGSMIVVELKPGVSSGGALWSMDCRTLAEQLCHFGHLCPPLFPTPIHRVPPRSSATPLPPLSHAH